MKSKILSMLILASAGMLLQTAFCEDRSKLDELKKDFRSFRIRAADREAKRGYLLEPLLPFDEAADKAKRGYPQGYYALALHYAKGVEIERDAELARQFLQKADSANYGNAVFVLAMLNELELFGDLSHRPLRRRDPDAVGIAKYIGVPVDSYKGMLSFTNKTDVALVRTGYERAINLGISVATNELARFERRLAKELARKRGYLLEPLLPFDEAADKAKRGYPQGYYALALHYAKGVEIERDTDVALQFLRKADSANYGNAVFVLAMLNELELFGDLSHRSLLMRDSDAVGIAKYTGVPVSSYKGTLSFTNKTDVALVRTGYERAIGLGISVATNELARFERRLEKEQAKAKESADNEARVAAIKAKNSEIAQSTLGILPASAKAKEPSSALSKRLHEERLPRRKIVMEPEMLEPILPLDETIKLVEERQGKGYYQLAIRYAQGNELPEDRGVAYKLLCKACDVNYANAVLVEGLCDEADLQECIPGSKIRRPAEMSDWMHGYCGTVFYTGRHDWDILTNEVAFARIMSKYVRAKDLGLFEATNHIARLNNRLANFKKEDAERNAKEKVKSENNSRVLSLLGDIAVTSEASAENGERQTVVDANSHAFLDNLHPAHIAIGMPSNFPEGSLVDNSPGTTSDLWSFYSSGMSGNGFRLLVITRITSPADYERNLHYAVATISAAGNIISVGPELGSINIYVGTK